jgi:two-component system, response regulator / RNA-binding antiterminator
MTSKRLRILVIDRNKVRASIIEEGLHQGGDFDVIVADDMTRLMRHVVEADPDVIILDLASPDRDMLEHALQVTRAVRRPIAMFVDTTDAAATEAAIDAGVSAYVVDGLRKERVKPILDMAISRFNAVDRLKRELETAKGELAERKTIDRAKSILMKSKGLDEQQAYQLLRKTAMNQSRKIAQVAESLVLAFSMINDEDPK